MFCFVFALFCLQEDGTMKTLLKTETGIITVVLGDAGTLEFSDSNGCPVKTTKYGCKFKMTSSSIYPSVLSSAPLLFSNAT